MVPYPARLPALVVGDVDPGSPGDEVIVQHAVDRSLRVLGERDGGLSELPIVMPAVAQAVSALEVTDLDADGRAELAVVELDSSWLRFTRVGSVDPGSSIEIEGLHLLEYEPSSRVLVAAGSDVAALISGSADAPEVVRVPLSPDSRSAVYADLDGDRLFDLATVHAATPGTSTLEVRWGTTEGLEEPVRVELNLETRAVAVIDADHDERLDLALLTDLPSLPGLQILRHERARTFSPWTHVELPGGPSAIESLDIDHDGFLDVIVGNQVANVVYGVIVREVPLVRAYFANGRSPVLAVGDVDADGWADVTTVSVEFDGSQSRTRVVRMRGTSSGFETRTGVRTSGRATGLASRDLNGDGLPDLLVAQTTAGTVETFQNAGDLVFEPSGAIGVTASPFGVLVTDGGSVITGDRFEDKVAWARGPAGPGADVSFLPMGPAYALAYGNVRGDEAPELLASVPQRSEVRISTFRDGEFGEVESVQLNAGVSAFLLIPAEGDGADVLMTYFDTGQIGVFRYDPELEFGSLPMETMEVGEEPLSIDARDLNKDGIVDLAVGLHSGAVVIMESVADGTWRKSQIVHVEGGVRWVALRDLDRDGEADLISLTDAGKVYLHFGWLGKFGEPLVFEAGMQVVSATLVDLDLDGAEDLVVTNDLEAMFSILQGGCAR